MIVTRRRNFSIFNWSKSSNYRPLISREDSPRTSDDSDYPNLYSPKPNPDLAPKRRRVWGLWTILTPNSSRFARHFHSRILQKYPFLIEMFYWVITYLFYRMTAYLSAVWYGGNDGLWASAQDHGIALLEYEAWVTGSKSTGTDRWVEWRVQQWFLEGAIKGDIRRTLLTILNRAYALIHIPGTVGFIAFYYATAPNFPRFATVRRTMSLLNLFAFFTFTVFPCMPPRLLPKEFGFIDTVNAEDAASVFMSGKFVNKLAAMPSMHFGYAFCIGCVFVYESGFMRQWCRPSTLWGKGRPASSSSSGGGGGTDSDDDHTLADDNSSSSSGDDTVAGSGILGYGRDDEAWKGSGRGADRQRSPAARITYLVLGVLYPTFILLCIVGTANHYILDAVVAAFVVLISYVCNRVLLNFLVLEDWLLWALRLEKPEPTTGRRC
jgi:hypothetical protein